MKKIFTVIILVALTGCAAPNYDGPGSFQDFVNARYQCVRETSARVSGAVVNESGGVANSQVMPSCSAFAACLASKGYYASQNGKFDPNAAGIVVRCN
jgi:hypothetical protein